MNRCVRCGFPESECGCPSLLRREASVNPWAEPATSSAAERPEWEFVQVAVTKAVKHPDLYRLRVPGGWLYRLGLKSTEMTFVPER